MNNKNLEKNVIYRFETPVYPANILYVNLVEKYSCTNDCLFCSRPRNENEVGKKNIYEKKTKTCLYLEKSPNVSRVVKEIKDKINENDTEIAFIGLGEPLIQYKKIIEIIKEIKYLGKKIRIDTNGTIGIANLAKKLKESGLDEIRISLNAINEKEYNILCRPKIKNAYENLINFVKESLDFKIETYVSFVTNFEHEKVSKRTEKEYLEFVEKLGIKKENVILRKYVEAI